MPVSGIVCLVIGVGLLRLSPAARSCQIFLLWLSLISLALFLPLAVVGAVTMTVMDVPIAGPNFPCWEVLLAGAAGMVGVGLSIWELRVLNHPEIRALFGQP